VARITVILATVYHGIADIVHISDVVTYGPLQTLTVLLDAAAQLSQSGLS
jgi:hypothetical protein